MKPNPVIPLHHLTALMGKRNFALKGYNFLSQDPTALLPKDRASVANLLPVFLAIWQAVEKATGHRWKLTSYIRNSPSHKKGHAIDLAPDFTPEADHLYAVSNGSDPVLYKRWTLIQQLQTLKNVDFTGQFPTIITGIFIEPDHLHIQVLNNDEQLPNPTRIVKWQIVKPAYADSAARANLPANFQPMQR